MTSLKIAERIIASTFAGPVIDSGPYSGTRGLLDMAARNYIWNRRVRGMGATAALALSAKGLTLSPTIKRPQWYGNRGGAGAVFKEGGDSLRWLESTDDSGLRFVDWSDKLPGGPDCTGWYCDSFQDSMLRGGVWQLPGRKGSARFVYGYAEFEGRGEMNPGSAAICVGTVIGIDRGGEDSAYDSQTDSDDMRDLARRGDGLAESAAETRRDYDSAYQEGRNAAESDNEAIAARKEALELIAGMKRAILPGVRSGVVWAALQAQVGGLAADIKRARGKRDSSYGDCGPWALEGWRAGFIDESEGGFLRAIRLGYCKASDWHGSPESNPCNKESS